MDAMKCPICGREFEEARIVEKVWHEVKLKPHYVAEDIDRMIESIVFIHDPDDFLLRQQCHLFARDNSDAINEYAHALFHHQPDSDKEPAESPEKTTQDQDQPQREQDDTPKCPSCGSPIVRVVLRTYDETVYEFQDGKFVILKSGGDAEKPEADPCGCRSWDLLDLVGF